MKKIMTLIILALCMIISSVCLAADKISPDDFKGVWYYAYHEVEGYQETAAENNRHLKIHIYEKNQRTIADYIDDTYTEDTERDVALQYVERDTPKDGASNNPFSFFDGSYYKLLRVHTRQPDMIYELFLQDKDTLVLSVEFPQDGARGTSTLFFKRTDPFGK